VSGLCIWLGPYRDSEGRVQSKELEWPYISDKNDGSECQIDNYDHLALMRLNQSGQSRSEEYPMEQGAD
jgi:hypothetical protein